MSQDSETPQVVIQENTHSSLAAEISGLPTQGLVDRAKASTKKHNDELALTFSRNPEQTSQEQQRLDSFLTDVGSVAQDETVSEEVRTHARNLLEQVTFSAEVNSASDLPPEGAFMGANVVFQEYDPGFVNIVGADNIEASYLPSSGSLRNPNAVVYVPVAEGVDQKQKIVDLLSRPAFQKDFDRKPADAADTQSDYSQEIARQDERSTRVEKIVETATSQQKEEMVNRFVEETLKRQREIVDYLKTGKLPDGVSKEDMDETIKAIWSSLLSTLGLKG